MGFCQRCGEISQRPKCPRCCGKIVESVASGYSDASTRKDPWVSRYVDIGFKKPHEGSSVKRMITTDLTPTTHCFTCGTDLRNCLEELVNPRKFGPQQCNQCYLQENGKGHCDECKKLVLGTGGPFVRYKDKVWHKDCLKCRHCGILIDDPLVDMTGLPCCNECFLKSGLHRDSKVRGLYSVSASHRLSKDGVDVIPTDAVLSPTKSSVPRDQTPLGPQDSYPAKKQERLSREFTDPSHSKVSRPKPEALYRFIKTTSNQPSIGSSSISSVKQPGFRVPSVFATARNADSISNSTSRSSSISPSNLHLSNPGETISESSMTRQKLPTDQKIPNESSPEMMIPNDTSPSKVTNSMSSMVRKEPDIPSKAAALFSSKKPEAYPPASTSINLAQTLSKSTFFNSKREKPTSKYQTTIKKDVSTPSPTHGGGVADDTKTSICCKCKKSVQSSWYSLPDDSTIHPECFVCEGCNTQFGNGSYTSFDGKFYHKKCIPDLRASPTPPRPDKKPNHSQAKVPNCFKCAKAIGGSWLTLSDGSKYHPSCFTCSLCYEEFEDGTFITKDGAPYHLHCIQRPQCEACHKQVNGPYVTRGPLTYHCGCFLCAICKKVIGAEMPFGEINHLVCCESCLLSDLDSKTRDLGIREATAPIYN